LQVLASYAPHDETLPSILRSRAEARPMAELLAGEIRGWRYADAERASELLAGLLRSHGVVKGDRVALVSLNSDLGPLLLLALGRIGAVFVPVNPALSSQEIGYVLKHCEPRLVIAQGDALQRVCDIDVGLDSATVVLGTPALGDEAADSAGVLRVLSDASGPGVDPGTVADLNADDPLVIIYTSGTTGFPKGVVHSHRNFVWAAEAFVERMHLQPDDRLLAILPFFHINALFYSFGGALACGGTLVTVPRFSASQFWHTAARHGATQLNILAAVGNILAKRPRAEFDAAHRIRKIYGGPISAEMMETFQREFGVPDLIEGFGMSEIPGAFNNPFSPSGPFGGPRKIGSIGKPARHPRLAGSFVEAKVVDDDRRTVPTGTVGELLVRTRISMLHYFKDPAQTREAYADGWLCTGDLARQDDDGYFYFVARKKDIIRRRGENIAGAELDRVLGSHPDILEAAAIGVPAPLGDEDILAVLVSRAQPAPSPEAILQWCVPHLAAMKLPRFIVFVDALPHTASERVAKFRLKEDRSLLPRAYDREAAEPKENNPHP
jgi:crotonobetaine/carnitine-CoA ligase